MKDILKNLAASVLLVVSILTIYAVLDESPLAGGLGIGVLLASIAVVLAMKRAKRSRA